jgi:hypothetical protein
LQGQLPSKTQPNMSTLKRPSFLSMVDDECKVQIDEAVFLRLLLHV